MAKENITKFFDAAMTDKALAEKLAALAVEHGYDFTADELLKLGAARPLSDEDLENTVGGIGADMGIIRGYWERERRERERRENNR